MPALNEKHPPTPEEDFIEQLSLASYHFADDTTKEWDQARACLRRAAIIVHDNGWEHDGEKIREMYNLARPLVDAKQVDDYIRMEGEARAATEPRK